MKKTIIICVAALTFISTSVFATGSKRPGVKWPPVANVVTEATSENHIN